LSNPILTKVAEVAELSIDTADRVNIGVAETIPIAGDEAR
jgi:hypothetical protein